jgi:ABC-2 type transport system ATP-binding protein
MIAAVEFNDVHKSYGNTRAVDGLTMRVDEGEVLCLLGPNGAGKSTSINMMLGLTSPDKGEVKLFGAPPTSDAARENIGLTPQDTDFPPNLTPREIIALVSSHFPQPQSCDHLIEAFQLDAIIDRRCGGFSGGERRRLALALAFAGSGKAIFLDEPTSGLDKDARHAFWDYATEHAKTGCSFVITTHHLEEIENIASRICLIVDGKIALEGSAESIRNRVNRKHIHFKCDEVPNLPDITCMAEGDGSYTITSTDSDAAIRALVHNNVSFRELAVRTCTLEEAIDTLSESSAQNTEART